MNEIIQSQIDLLVDLNRDLAGPATPEAAREIRENVLAIVKLTGIQEGVKIQGILEDLEERLEALEEVLFKGEEPDLSMLENSYGHRHSLMNFTRDCREDIDTVYNWMEKLETHLDLDEDWADQYDEGAGA